MKEMNKKKLKNSSELLRPGMIPVDSMTPVVINLRVNMSLFFGNVQLKCSSGKCSSVFHSALHIQINYIYGIYLRIIKIS